MSRERALASPGGRSTPALRTAPEVIGEHRGGRFYERVLRVPVDLACLDGHFPGFPVVPGVVQVSWVLDAARVLLGDAMRLSEIKALKFKDFLGPGQTLTLRVNLASGDTAVVFLLSDGERVFSSGRCLLERKQEGEA